MGSQVLLARPLDASLYYIVNGAFRTIAFSVGIADGMLLGEYGIDTWSDMGSAALIGATSAGLLTWSAAALGDIDRYNDTGINWKKGLKKAGWWAGAGALGGLGYTLFT